MSTPVLDIGCPVTSTSAHNQELFATAYHAGVVKRLAAQADRDPVTAELFAVLAKAQAGVPIASACWQPEIGAAARRLRDGDVVGAVVLALFATHALRAGGAWELRTRETIRASLGGHILDLSGRVTVTAGADAIEIATQAAAGSPLAFTWTDAGWRLATDTPHPIWNYAAPDFVDFDGFRDVYVHAWAEPENAGPDIIVNWPIPRSPALQSSGLGALGAQNIARGLGALANAGEQYLRWVRPLFRGVAATPLTHDDMRQSGSYTEHAGVFNCGFPGGAESIAEVIVHEVSHQNFLLLNAVYPLARDQEGESFYSSLKGSDRPLSRVLLAYHAAANMALFWDDLGKRVALREYYLAEQDEMNRHVDSLAVEIGRATGLTEAGQLLFRAQDEVLKQRGLVPC
ncbi:MAG: hypothetical protein QOI11_676 [Candidatus Eremiobacteraeota bacterium]|jgi:HEXXH motif-containing protein|nr:hypothetical protein [Candidatus Eremiobacteraeota bacterium]